MSKNVKNMVLVKRVKRLNNNKNERIIEVEGYDIFDGHLSGGSIKISVDDVYDKISQGESFYTGDYNDNDMSDTTGYKLGAEIIHDDQHLTAGHKHIKTKPSNVSTDNLDNLPMYQ